MIRNMRCVMVYVMKIIATKAKIMKMPSRMSTAVPPQYIVTAMESTQKIERKTTSCLRRKKIKPCLVMKI